MKKKLILSVLGVIAFATAIVLLYLFLIGLDAGGNPLLFVGSLACIGAGVFALVKATYIPKPVKENYSLPIVSNPEANEELQKKNQMSKDFEKTIKAREQLRMLELADSAQKKP